MRRTILLTVVMALAAACGGDRDTAGSSTTVPPASTTTVAGATTTVPPTTTTVPETTTTVSDTTTTTIPGEVIDYGPQEGDVLMVVGVPHDEHLNVRVGPGVDQEIITTLAPTDVNVVARGETRKIPNAFWIEIETEDAPGWVHAGYVGYQGSTYDQTAWVYESIGGYPSAATMTQLGEIVASTFATEDPLSKVVKVIDDTVGDLGEVTYDVIGIGDDAGLGFRLHVFGEPFEGGFILKSVEVTDICGRGVSESGLCA